ncbi:MAG: HD domain-containing protein [Myxococcales bacterium]|nr:HD domain-containing protein [Myxococcales bacterium]
MPVSLGPSSSAGRHEARRRQFHDLAGLLGLAVDLEDASQLGHSFRVAVLALEIGRNLSVPEGEVFYGGLLHDVGQILVPRPARAGLHSQRGAGLLRPFSSLRALENVVANHHERWDGLGWPNGLSGREIPLPSAVVAIADAIDTQLREVSPPDRPAAAVAASQRMRQTLVSNDVADAALQAIDQSPGLFATLFDDAELRRLVGETEVEPLGLEELEDIELVAEMLWLIARVADSKHAHRIGHSARVAFMARDIAARLGDVVDQWDVVCAALLHDVGKLRVSPSILTKSTPLQLDEVTAIQAHAIHTRVIVENLSGLSYLAHATSSHHEAWDGAGYPRGLSGEAIPLVARVIAYADAYDALRSDRSFRDALPVDLAIATLREMAGHQLDPAMLDVALDALTATPGQSPSDLLGFQAFFPAGRGPSLDLESRPPTSWHDVRLTDSGRVRADLSALGALTSLEEANLLDHFAESERPSITEAMQRSTGPRAARAHTSRKGHAVELAFSRDERGLVAHVRRADEVARPLRDLAFAHRNFLQSAEAVMFTDAQARIVDVNYAFTRLFGWRAEEVVGLTPKFLQSGQHPAALYEAMRDSLVTPEVGAWSGEIVNQTKSGRLVAVELRVNAVRDASGNVIGYVSSALDITVRRREREALEASERDLRAKNAELERLNQFKDQMVALTSHDLRSPLASIIQTAELLAETCRELSAEEVGRRASLVADVGHQLVGLVTDLLDLDRLEAGNLAIQPRRFHPGGLVHTIAAAPTSKARVTAVVRDDRASVVADPERVEQALQNLVSNALKFAPPDTTVELGFEAVGAGGARFWVDDRGAGIPEEALEGIFDRYNQLGGAGSRGVGYGLGLAIVRHIATLHGGHAFAENRASGGTRFTLELPPAESVVRSALVLGPADADLRRVARLLESSGFVVLSASRLAEAQRRVAIEAPALTVVHGPWLPELPIARREGALLVAVTDDDAQCCPDLDAVFVRPVMEVELASVIRAARPEHGGSNDRWLAVRTSP